MLLIQRIRSLFSKASPGETSGADQLRKAAESLREQRGENVTALPAERGGYSAENVKNAARDLGPNIMTGPDAIGDVGKHYRSSK